MNARTRTIKSDLHVAALQWAEAGFFIFPVLPGRKEPAIKSNLELATTDAATIDTWWTENPNYNIGAAPHLSGNFVLDADPPLGFVTLQALEAAHGELPTTRTFTTPRGGLHYWFEGDGPSSANKLGPKLDTRGEGGYVLLPPSSIGKGQYTNNPDGGSYVARDNISEVECPSWIMERLKTANAKRVAGTDTLDTAGNISRLESTLVRYVKAGDVAIEGGGGNDRTFRLCCEALDLGLSVEKAAEVILTGWNDHCSPPWEASDLVAILEHAAQYRQNEVGSYAVKPAAETYAQIAEAAAYEEPEATAAKNEEPNAKPARIIVLRDEAMQNTREAPSWLIKDFLPKVGTPVIGAKWASFKSFVATDAMLSVASGRPCFNHLPVLHTGPAVYLTGEALGGFESLRRPAWRLARNIPEGQKLPIYTCDGLPIVKNPDDVQLYFDALSRMKTPPAIIVIDTLARAMVGLKEDDAGDAGIYIHMVDELVRVFQCCVLTIAHTGKDEERGIRGSSNFSGGFEAVWMQEGDNSDKSKPTVRMTSEKQKDGAAPEPICLRGHEVELPNGRSLVFDWIAPDDFKSATRKNSNGLQRGDVGKALIALKAVKGVTVTTHVLAVQLAGPGADDATIAAKSKYLRRSAEDRFGAYVAHHSESRGDATLWTFPPLEDGGEVHE